MKHKEKFNDLHGTFSNKTYPAKDASMKYDFLFKRRGRGNVWLYSGSGSSVPAMKRMMAGSAAIEKKARWRIVEAKTGEVVAKN